MKKILLSTLFILFSLNSFNSFGHEGANYFYHNFSKFEICLGSSYGCHDITRVSLRGNIMTVFYSYKNGILEGYLEPNGVYEGDYETRSSTGTFITQFYPTSGESRGKWRGGFFAGGKLNFRRK